MCSCVYVVVSMCVCVHNMYTEPLVKVYSVLKMFQRQFESGGSRV